jgi:DNA-binding NarL/FixJ family response regulator
MNTQERAVIDLVIIDDHPIKSMGVSRLLNRLPDMKVVAVCLTEEDAVEAIHRLQPKVVLADLHNPRASMAKLTRAVHDAAADARILVVTKAFADADHYRAAGAAGVITESALSRLAEGIREAAAGAPWVEYS